MRSINVIFSIALLGASAVALGAPSVQPVPPMSPTNLRCEFDSRDKHGRLECWAKIHVCTIDELARLGVTTCRNSMDLDCDDGTGFFDDREVRVERAEKDLRIEVRNSEVTVEEFDGTSDGRFRAFLSLFSRHKSGERRHLRGECVAKSTQPPVPTGSCQPSSSLSVLVSGTNAVSYVPKGSWSGGTTGIAAVNVEGTSITNTLIPTAKVVNSCASNPTTGQTVCTANNTDVYLLSGTTLNSTLTSGGSGSIGFSGGSCTNCGVAMDATHNKALLGLSIANKPGFQFLDLSGTPTFEAAFASPSGLISEDPLIDPIRNLVLSPSERGNYEIVNATTSTSPTFFENATGGGVLDSAGEDCSTGIALAPAEFSGPSNVYIADITQAVFTAGTPSGTWTAPSQIQTLTESNLEAGASGIAVAQGTHTGVVTGEFGGNTLTAITLPAASGSGTPAISDWVTCGIAGFSMGRDPHTVTAYQSPNGGNAIALLANSDASQLAVVDLTMMLNTTTVPRTVAGHGCASGTLPAAVVRIISVP